MNACDAFNSNCVYHENGMCKLHSDPDVKEMCVQGPCFLYIPNWKIKPLLHCDLDEMIDSTP